jgi:hypothetical protein
MAFTPPTKKNIVHVGYKIKINDSVKELIKPILDCKLNEDPITAIHYQAQQSVMSAWFDKMNKKSPVTGYLKGLYVDTRLKYIVGHFTIDAAHTWVILSKGTSIAPANLKRKVSSGELGAEIAVDRVTV